VRSHSAALVAALLGSAMVFGCSHGQVVRRSPEYPVIMHPAPAKVATPAPAPTKAAPPAFSQKDGAIYFDYDRALLPGDAGTRLQTIATWLKQHPQVQLRIEGNCDERGTDEYNLALGDRRARSAKAYLEQLGVDSARVMTVSYGKEKPQAPGHDEQSWRRNRRDDLRLR
jgi:peptidoglycan-associated lipoprotein